MITKRYKDLIKILHEISLIQNQEQLLSYIVESARNIADAEAAFVFFPNYSNTRLLLVSSYFLHNGKTIELTLPIDNCLEGWAYKNKQSIVINHPETYKPIHGNLLKVPDFPVKSVLIIPIVYGNKKVGILEVINQPDGGFTAIDEELLASLALQGAISIDKAHQTLQSEMISELVHELRTPLASLNTALHLLQRADLPEDRRSHISQLVQTEFTRLSDLTSSYLDYARLQSGKENFEFSKFDLLQLITDNVDMMRIQVDSKGFTIDLSLPREPVFITADRNKIKQVIINLVNNAIKYNQPDGEITISATTTPGYAVIRIQDNGIGISAEHIPHLFEHFYRVPHTERQIIGSGLGLAICKQIIDGHNGKIEVSSALGEGSVFTVILPING